MHQYSKVSDNGDEKVQCMLCMEAVSSRSKVNICSSRLGVMLYGHLMIQSTLLYF